MVAFAAGGQEVGDLAGAGVCARDDVIGFPTRRTKRGTTVVTAAPGLLEDDLTFLARQAPTLHSGVRLAKCAPFIAQIAKEGEEIVDGVHGGRIANRRRSRNPAPAFSSLPRVGDSARWCPRILRLQPWRMAAVRAGDRPS